MLESEMTLCTISMHLLPTALNPVVARRHWHAASNADARFRLWRLNRYGEDIECRMRQTPKEISSLPKKPFARNLRE
jgi:hypothetical protein